MITRRKFIAGAACGVTGLLQAAPVGLPFFARSSGCADGGVTADWAARVVANGGTAIPAANQSAVCSFVLSGISDGWWSKMVTLSIFDPTSLIGAITPLKVGGGNDPWQNQSNNFVGGDLTVNGLTGNAGTPKYLKTGINPSTLSNQAASGLFCYAYTVASDGLDIGAYDGTNFFFLAGKYSDNNAYSRNGLLVNNVILASSGNGYYANVRASATDHKLYFASSGSAHAQIGSTDSTLWAGTLPNTNTDGMYVFGVNQVGGSNYLNCSDTISAAGCFVGFTGTDSANLFTRLQTLRTAFGGGYR